jgi:hypothetical protein
MGKTSYNANLNERTVGNLDLVSSAMQAKGNNTKCTGFPLFSSAD